ncbi:hypothetical protein [Ferrimonas balearica]|uniref:hypothetical protein n=1 Tax=Ferrimonas balearica TaxID=44012 RepID=UPI001F1CE57C|nr:hypothetical protein [Ferrimonas balearica]MBY6017992.1 hypothetical protein [Halomonas denitrificans]MBY6094327.1 hypothetical protein [Ferrimonas balearica]
MAWLLITLLLCLILLIGVVDIRSVALGEWGGWWPLLLALIGFGILLGRWIGRLWLGRRRNADRQS